MRRLIAWWMTAPWDEREAVFFVLGIWTLGALVWLIDPASHH
jgi:hypothetical protein